jgi:hypothetical protein
MLTTFFPIRGHGWAATVSWLAVNACIFLTGGGAMAADSGALHLRCTNDSSGASWQIVIDLDHSRVDSQPATVTDRSISWADPKQGHYDLDRATGKLEFTNASSTGGYYLHYTCKPE